MVPPSTAGKDLLRGARTRLDEWKIDARDRAYADLFEGPEAALSGEELRLLDRIDSELARRGGDGLWGSDEYGIVAGETLGTGEPRVVCTYHPEIPLETVRGVGGLDESSRAAFNDVLWDYCERVAAVIQDDLDAYLRAHRSGE
jgi:hypothetical protein